MRKIEREPYTLFPMLDYATCDVFIKNYKDALRDGGEVLTDREVQLSSGWAKILKPSAYSLDFYLLSVGSEIWKFNWFRKLVQ
jgi:hypothetical protein